MMNVAKQLYRNLLPWEVLVNHRGSLFLCRPGNIDIYILNDYSERKEWDLVKPTWGDVVVDIGAHVGKYTIPCAEYVGVEGEVVAFEAIPEHYQGLKENIELNSLSNCTAINAAAYKVNSEMWLVGWDLQEAPDPDHPQNESVNPDGSLQVTTRRVDDVLKKLGIGQIDLVKIDVGKQEVEVLEGMETTLEESEDIQVLIEVAKRNEARVDEILREMGYEKRPLGDFTSAGLRDILYSK